MLLLIAAAVIAAVLIAALAGGPGDGEQGPPTGGGRQGAEEGTSTLEVQGVGVLDPNGDGEHDEEAPLAFDGDDSTSWTTENYNDPFSLLGKSGVGLVFDLGDGAEVSQVEVVGCPDCGLAVGVADDTSETDDSIFETVAETESFNGDAFEFEAAGGRYWLVFVTSLPGGGGGRATIAEVKFSGSSG